MRKLKIIDGQWRIQSQFDVVADGYYVGNTRNKQGMGNNYDIDHAILIADAGNTYHATGMLPSEMAKRIKALEEALQECKDALMAVEYWRQMKHRNKSIHDPRLVIRVDPKYVWPQVKAAISDARALLTPHQRSPRAFGHQP